MRDIKFRAWNIDKKRWETDYERCYLNEEGCCEIEFTNMYTSGLRRINAVVNLYTGLKDKNGKEIYEADILRAPHFVDSRGKQHWLFHEIMWDEKHTGWKAVSLNNAEGKEITAHGNPQLFVYMKNEGAAEVYGNIYENSNLLNSDKEVQGSDTRDGDSSTKAD